MINCQTNDLQPYCTLVNSNLQLTTNKKQGTQVQTFERVSPQSRLYHQCRSISASERMKHRGHNYTNDDAIEGEVGKIFWSLHSHEFELEIRSLFQI